MSNVFSFFLAAYTAAVMPAGPPPIIISSYIACSGGLKC
jgi:hypothetical protein